MKNISVVLLAVVALVFAGLADAAPKKRSRSTSRIGPYGMGAVGHTSFTSDQSQIEQDVLDSLSDTTAPIQNLGVKTDAKDVGYNFSFGYRFTRYFACELALAQYGSLITKGSADMDFGDGFVPVNIKFTFSAGGPLVSAVGILPLNDQFELYGRVGYLFTASERELSTSVDGQRAGFGSIKGDSQDLVLGAGAAYHFNQVYSLRLEYQKLDSLGTTSSSGEEDLNVTSLGLVVRF